jgi:hypothetical protein
MGFKLDKLGAHAFVFACESSFHQLVCQPTKVCDRPDQPARFTFVPVGYLTEVHNEV